MVVLPSRPVDPWREPPAETPSDEARSRILPGWLCERSGDMRPGYSEGTPAASHGDGRTPAPAATRASAAALDHSLARLQQTIGNQAVQRLLGTRPAQPRVHAGAGDRQIPTPAPVTRGARIRQTAAAGASAPGPAEALTRFRQPSGRRLLQRDFRSDFDGKVSTPAASNAPAAPGTVRVQTYAPQEGTATWVDAPYGIYSPGEIPKEYHGQIMESGKAFQWRNEGRVDNVGFQRELERLENRGELTVGDMLKLSRKAGADMNIRIAMAKVGNDFRFVGYDMSQGDPGRAVHSGFVESERGTTSGVGRALFADRITRALLNQASGMNLEVYTTKRTADFHAQIFAVAGRQGAPTEGQRYRLTTGEMAKLAVAWNPMLTETQVSNLNALLARGDNVSAADAEAALLRGAVQDRPPRGSGGGRSSGGSGSGGPSAEIPVADIISPRAEAKGALLEWGAQALLAAQISNMQSAEKDKALARFAELSPEIGRLLDENYSVTITVEAEVPKTVNIAGVATQTDPSMIVYFRNMYIDHALKVLPKRAPGGPDQAEYHALAEVADEYSNPGRWDDPHEDTLDQQIRRQMGDPDPTGRDKPKHPTHKVMKQSQTLTPAIVDALDTVRNNPQAAAPPPRPKPKMDAETARKLAAAPTRVYLLTESTAQYKAAAQVREKLKANPIFHVTGEAMAGGTMPLTRVIYWSEYDKPRAEKLAELLRAEGLPEARADSGGDPSNTPGYLQINFGRDAEK